MFNKTIHTIKYLTIFQQRRSHKQTQSSTIQL